MKRRTHILIGIPTYKTVPGMCSLSAASTIVECGAAGLLATVSGKVDMYITTARNELCEYAIRLRRKRAATHLLQLDDDMILPHGTVQQLVSRHVGVVSGAYWGKSLRPIVYDLGEGELPCTYWRAMPRTGLHRADGLGAGCLLIDIDVLIAMQRHYKDKRWFQNVDGAHYLGEDVFFFRRLKEMGIPAYVDADAPCGHVGNVVIDRDLVDANIRSAVADLANVRRRHWAVIGNAMRASHRVACKPGCSFCCHGVRADACDGLVALAHLQQNGMWTDELRASLRVESDDCPFLVSGHCSIYPARPAVCATFFGATPPRCGKRGVSAGSMDENHARVAKALVDKLILPERLYTLRGAILTAEAIVSGLPLPDVWSEPLRGDHV